MGHLMVRMRWPLSISGGDRARTVRRTTDCCNRAPARKV